MKISKLSLDLVVNSVESTARFYSDILGFEILEIDQNFARLKAGDSEIMLMSKSDFDREVPALNRPKNEGWTVLIMEVMDIKDVYESIRSKVEIIRELQRTNYGTQEFLLKDPDGYLIQFTQRD
jgi:uncharacterized glyoxalase superfamily protein PhnB